MTNSANHNPSARPYYLAFTALLALTALTVGAAFVDLGGLNNAAALAIAAAKAALVAAVFMHVRGASRLVQACIAVGCIWLAILIGLTMADFSTRSW